MAPTIGTQDGIWAAGRALHRLDPRPDTDEGWVDKLTATLRTLKAGHNDVWREGGFADRLAEVERRLPFPAAS